MYWFKWRCHANDAGALYSHNNSGEGIKSYETELNPFQDPQPVKVAEKQGDAFGAPGWEHESGGGVEDRLQPVQ